ncbi:MAG: TraR/DksA C4-type zinc finger protein [Oligoflexia bacterium]|nr:TraR/DksA C4-type zinc finger protein [Oligoflexia bacterium]
MVISSDYEERRLTSKQIETLKELLVQKKRDLNFRSRYSEDFHIDTNERSDEIDFANADAVNSEQIRFRNRETFFEKKIDEALQRIDDNEYDLCEECNGPIGYLRLLARPTANLCIICKEDAERDEVNTYFSKNNRHRGKMLSYLSSDLRD